jgi:hypothetical protein
MLEEHDRSSNLRDAFELLEPERKPVSVRVMLLGAREPDQRPCDRFEALLEQRPVVQHQQALGDVDPAVGVDADQVIVEGGVVNWRPQFAAASASRREMRVR